MSICLVKISILFLKSLFIIKLIMSLEKAVEAIIKEAQERGDFDNLKNKGKPIDLSAYFETPEEVRMAYSMLQNAGIVSVEVELLQEIAALKERLAAIYEESQRSRIKKIISEKQLQFDVMLEKQKRQSKKSKREPNQARAGEEAFYRFDKSSPPCYTHSIG